MKRSHFEGLLAGYSARVPSGSDTFCCFHYFFPKVNIEFWFELRECVEPLVGLFEFYFSKDFFMLLLLLFRLYRSRKCCSVSTVSCCLQKSVFPGLPCLSVSTTRNLLNVFLSFWLRLCPDSLPVQC